MLHGPDEVAWETADQSETTQRKYLTSLIQDNKMELSKVHRLGPD